MLEGYTTAGGFEIMINCDFAIAEENAKIGDFHIRRALFGGAGPIYRLPRILGERKAKELMLTGKLLTGREAYEFGLVNDWAPGRGARRARRRLRRASSSTRARSRCGSRRCASTAVSTPTPRR